jgi:hypothetical protein
MDAKDDALTTYLRFMGADQPRAPSRQRLTLVVLPIENTL